MLRNIMGWGGVGDDDVLSTLTTCWMLLRAPTMFFHGRGGKALLTKGKRISSTKSRNFCGGKKLQINMKDRGFCHGFFFHIIRIKKPSSLGNPDLGLCNPELQWELAEHVASP